MIFGFPGEIYTRQRTLRKSKMKERVEDREVNIPSIREETQFFI